MERLPDPDLFRDAWFLYQNGIAWTPSALDECDALVLALVQTLLDAKRGTDGQK